LVTGGEGFIGSNFISFLLNSGETGLKDLDEKGLKIYNLDRCTYAGRGENLAYDGLSKDSRYQFIWGDIRDRRLVTHIFDYVKPDMVFNFAAESHVDRSVQDSDDFLYTNVGGTISLLEAARTVGNLERFVQVSTDEVYGSREMGSFTEEDRTNPSNPYAASKAAAESFALAYHKTHDVPAVITRSSNNYGPFQFPEKLIPLFITNLIEGKKVPLMWSEKNPGLNARDWLHVEDNCRAIWHVANKGTNGEIYNIPGDSEISNLGLTGMLLFYFNKGGDRVERIPHRKGHDFRYAMSGKKLARLGFKPSHEFKKGLDDTCKWYIDNERWWRPLKA
jgi:dTDP-glucose 4,6-dehydratase